MIGPWLTRHGPSSLANITQLTLLGVKEIEVLHMICERMPSLQQLHVHFAVQVVSAQIERKE